MGRSEALNLPEVVARKCLVKNAMTDTDEESADLMPTIKLSGLSSVSNLVQKLPKPAYEDGNRNSSSATGAGEPG